MGKRRLAALIGAAVLTFAAVGSVTAKPVYTIDVTKVADPASVPAEGADVTFTVTVTATSGDFHTVNVDDTMVGCTLSGPTGDVGSDGILSNGESWTYTCTVTGVAPSTQNTANVAACHDSSPNCNSDSHDASGQGQVTVGECEADCPTAQPPTPEPTMQPTTQPTSTGGAGGETNIPSQAPTDTALIGSSAPADIAWLLVVGLGVLIGSLVVLRPAGSANHRR